LQAECLEKIVGLQLRELLAEESQKWGLYVNAKKKLLGLTGNKLLQISVTTLLRIRFNLKQKIGYVHVLRHDSLYSEV